MNMGGVHSILKHVQEHSLSTLGSRINPTINVLDYMHKCQELSSCKLSLVDTSLLPTSDKALYHLPRFNL